MNKARPQSSGWRKSSYSGQSGQECVEVAPFDGVVGTRDSKDLTVGHITIEPASWSALIGSIKTA
ncbi:DUF397 domain-containing protein [Embleya sp. AB8]|uniref:DUF397 domain-containing protein n=1 Tax=Embleya sp. AB8 TaxID=3156304 RepID=UPI003C74FC04